MEYEVKVLVGFLLVVRVHSHRNRLRGLGGSELEVTNSGSVVRSTRAAMLVNSRRFVAGLRYVYRENHHLRRLLALGDQGIADLHWRGFSFDAIIVDDGPDS